MAIDANLMGKVFMHSGPPSNAIRFHQHDEIEINLILSGSATVYIDNVPCAYRPGEFRVILPHQSHAMTSGSADCSFWVWCIRPDWAQRFSSHPDRAWITYPTERPLGAVSLDAQRLKEVASACSKMAERPIEDVDHYNAKMAHYFTQFAPLLRACRTQTKDDLKHDMHPGVARIVYLLDAGKI